MPFPLFPKLITDELTDLTPEFLQEQGIELLMLDFDNTIVPYTTDIPTPLMEQWLMDAAEWDIPVCVVSNSKRDRVKIFCRHYGIDCITHARKPFTKGDPGVPGKIWRGAGKSGAGGRSDLHRYLRCQ